jgi:hypothetical protein
MTRSQVALQFGPYCRRIRLWIARRSIRESHRRAASEYRFKDVEAGHYQARFDKEAASQEVRALFVVYLNNAT